MRGFLSNVEASGGPENGGNNLGAQVANTSTHEPVRMKMGKTGSNSYPVGVGDQFSMGESSKSVPDLKGVIEEVGTSSARIEVDDPLFEELLKRVEPSARPLFEELTK